MSPTTAPGVSSSGISMVACGTMRPELRGLADDEASRRIAAEHKGYWLPPLPRLAGSLGLHLQGLGRRHGKRDLPGT